MTHALIKFEDETYGVVTKYDIRTTEKITIKKLYLIKWQNELLSGAVMMVGSITDVTSKFKFFTDSNQSSTKKQKPSTSSRKIQQHNNDTSNDEESEDDDSEDTQEFAKRLEINTTQKTQPLNKNSKQKDPTRKSLNYSNTAVNHENETHRSKPAAKNKSFKHNKTVVDDVNINFFKQHISIDFFSR